MLEYGCSTASAPAAAAAAAAAHAKRKAGFAHALSGRSTSAWWAMSKAPMSPPGRALSRRRSSVGVRAVLIPVRRCARASSCHRGPRATHAARQTTPRPPSRPGKRAIGNRPHATDVNERPPNSGEPHDGPPPFRALDSPPRHRHASNPRPRLPGVETPFRGAAQTPPGAPLLAVGHGSPTKAPTRWCFLPSTSFPSG